MEESKDKIRRYRRRAMLTQRELAEKAGVGVGTVSRLEEGVVTDPRFSTLRKLAAVLKVTPRDLMNMDDDER
jgi:transcriptional regulator with XRE-family HTH domain